METGESAAGAGAQPRVARMTGDGSAAASSSFRGWRHLLEHVLFVQKLRPEKKDLYVEAHNNPPADLLRVLRDSGVQREVIWVQGENVYIYVMGEDFDKAIANQSKSQIFRDWVQR